MKMTRETQHEKFPAQVLMDLAAFRPFRTHGKDGNLHVCQFDKKLKQNAFNNLLLSNTPYRCSLGKPKGMEAQHRKAKRAHGKATEDASSTYVSLPKIPLASELIRRRNDSSEYNKRLESKQEFIRLESDGEEPCDFLSCGSMKMEEPNHEAVSSQPVIKETARSRSLPLLLDRGNSSSCLKCNTRACKFKLQTDRENYPARNMVRNMDSDLCYLDNNSSNDQEFTKVMEDGARVTVKQKRLSIEIFMPRTS